ncbi:hypothetical protein BDZ89DRAFT_1141263 [Hymenopellis radicata]|nr:hypothetical protein BDZ89DRAFT_1141263 [Hymenopellis radicata]
MGPPVLETERVLPIIELNDRSAKKLILALVHDCFIVINQLHWGLVANDTLSLRSRLLSLYIATEDIQGYREALQTQGLTHRFFALNDLVALRDRVLFSDRHDAFARAEMYGTLERDGLNRIITNILRESPVGMIPHDALVYSVVLDAIQHHLGADIATFERVDQICNAIRMTFNLAPWTPLPTAGMPHTPSLLTPKREMAMACDVFCAFSDLVAGRKRESRELWSIRDDDRGTVYHYADQHARHLVLARDVLCGLVSGPTRLGADGAFTMYIKPLMQCRLGWHLNEDVSARAAWSAVEEGFSLLDEASRSDFEQRNILLSRFELLTRDHLVDLVP